MHEIYFFSEAQIDIAQDICVCMVAYISRPHLIKDITMIEQLQRRATRFILNDYQSCYFDRLVKLQLFPLMYAFELADIMFAIKALKSPSDSFDITNYVSFSYGSTKSSKNGKLRHIRSLDSKSKHFYFNRLPRLWNTLPPLTCLNRLHIIT